MNKLLYLAYLAASSEDEFKNSPFFGAFSGAQRVIGVIVLITGVLIVYFGIKVNMGYRFLDDETETVIKEDNFEETKAAVGEKKVTLMPDFGDGGDKEYVEYDISYQVGEKTYIHSVPDGEYKTGDMLKLRFDPNDPDNFYLCEDEEEDEEEAQPEQKKNFTAIMMIAAGVLLIAVGIGLII